MCVCVMRKKSISIYLEHNDKQDLPWSFFLIKPVTHLFIDAPRCTEDNRAEHTHTHTHTHTHFDPFNQFRDTQKGRSHIDKEQLGLYFGTNTKKA